MKSPTQRRFKTHQVRAQRLSSELLQERSQRNLASSLLVATRRTFQRREHCLRGEGARTSQQRQGWSLGLQKFGQALVRRWSRVRRNSRTSCGLNLSNDELPFETCHQALTIQHPSGSKRRDFSTTIKQKQVDGGHGDVHAVLAGKGRHEGS